MAIDWDLLVIGPTVATFGEAVMYSPDGGAPFPITGVFDQAYMVLTPFDANAATFSDLQLGSVITTEKPVLGVQLSQFPPLLQPTQADTLVVRGRAYVVKEVRLDSHGGAKLMLNVVDPD
jgi:hypothetical protein